MLFEQVIEFFAGSGTKHHLITRLDRLPLPQSPPAGMPYPDCLQDQKILKFDRTWDLKSAVIMASFRRERILVVLPR